MEDDVQTAQVTTQSDSGGVETPSTLQETPASSQEPQTSQESESLKVEQSQQQTSSEPPARKASDFYRDRKEIRNLKNMISQLNDKITSMASVPKEQQSAGESQLSQAEIDRLEKELLDKPIPYLNRRESEMRKAIKEELLKELREKELPTFVDNREKQLDLKRKEQEALELIFPKSESNPKESLDDRVKSDPKKAELILDIMEEYGLNHFASVDPVNAAKKALELYDWKMQTAKKSPMAVKKSGMASTTSGTPIGGSEKTDAQDLIKQKEELQKRISENSDLMSDPKFIEQLDKISLALAKHKEN